MASRWTARVPLLQALNRRQTAAQATIPLADFAARTARERNRVEMHRVR